MKPLFITGIGTNVGKSVVAAVLTERLMADYWKPIQSGDLDDSDSDLIRRLLTNAQSTVHLERFRLALSASPHKSAALEGIQITLDDFSLPESDRPLVVEGAGGIMVPLSDTLLMVHLIEKFSAEVILVVRNYLGCINHSLLSYAYLRMKEIEVKAIVFNGTMDPDSEKIISTYIGRETDIWRLPEMETLTKNTIKQATSCLKF
ncbi:dethiobiotin synthase [Olivibacter sp. SDN3]|uniref:dethiobiotin synthase n=1 Tax=Olivibacter sp. SDN3 TaxID=2764720 RepID=UPI001650DC62|nr:dethiobiotin synthase [Olivibacter sp. SDN3]QNL48548.1 dethiobiotin synthase [Olivibacter sp. SDN3]